MLKSCSNFMLATRKPGFAVRRCILKKEDGEFMVGLSGCTSNLLIERVGSPAGYAVIHSRGLI